MALFFLFFGVYLFSILSYLVQYTITFFYCVIFSFFSKFIVKFGLCRNALEEYTQSVRKMTSTVLEMITDGLGIKPRNTLTQLVSNQNTESILRLNHYPPCPLINKKTNGGKNVIGFGEHTDPQIISVLRSNNTSGLQINITDGSWISVPSDPSSFFFNVGDSLQVCLNRQVSFFR